MDGLEDAIQEMEGNVIFAGDFNAKDLEWGIAELDCSVKLVVETSSRSA